MHVRVLLIGLLACVLFGCGGPNSFVKMRDTSNSNWQNIEMRDNLKYEDAWKQMVDTVAQKFDIEVVSQDSAYLRTAWDHKWTGNYTDNYAVRATIKFSPDRKYLQIKSEATYKDLVGEDERLTQTLKNDLMGKIGRVTQ
jgi:hypothetical protein